MKKNFHFLILRYDLMCSETKKITNKQARS